MEEVYSHLSEEECRVIQIEIGSGAGVRGIGLMPGCNASTVSREIKRSTWFPSDENGSCRPCRPKRLKTGPWTGGCCIAVSAGRAAFHAAAGGDAGVAAGGRRVSRFPGRVPISERPPEAGDRGGFGHWEADGVIGAGCNLHTEVERKTRFLMARIVPDKTAGESVGAQLAMFSPLPAGARVSVTHDNGTGFARCTRLRDEPGMDTYFADPYSSWQRGSNENRNGMIRRYLPKRSEIRMDMAGELREIVDEVNNRPMRMLEYRTPAEAFADELLELQAQQGCCTSK